MQLATKYLIGGVPWGTARIRCLVVNCRLDGLDALLCQVRHEESLLQEQNLQGGVSGLKR